MPPTAADEVFYTPSTNLKTEFFSMLIFRSSKTLGKSNSPVIRLQPSVASRIYEIVELTGSERIVYFELNGSKCSAKIPLDYKFDKDITLNISANNLYFFNKETGENFLYE